MSENPEPKKEEKKVKKPKKKAVKKNKEAQIIEPDLRPWDQQPGEPSNAYSWFLTYRDLGEGRTFKKAFAKEKKYSGGHINDTSKKWNWVERCNQFDIFVKQERWKKKMVSQDQINEHSDRLAFVSLEKMLEAMTSIHPEQLAKMIKENKSIKDVIDLVKVIKGEKLTAKVSGKVNMTGGMTKGVMNAFLDYKRSLNEQSKT